MSREWKPHTHSAAAILTWHLPLAFLLSHHGHTCAGLPIPHLIFSSHAHQCLCQPFPLDHRFLWGLYAILHTPHDPTSRMYPNTTLHIFLVHSVSKNIHRTSFPMLLAVRQEFLEGCVYYAVLWNYFILNLIFFIQSFRLGRLFFSS